MFRRSARRSTIWVLFSINVRRFDLSMAVTAEIGVERVDRDEQHVGLIRFLYLYSGGR